MSIPEHDGRVCSEGPIKSWVLDVVADRVPLVTVEEFMEAVACLKWVQQWPQLVGESQNDAHPITVAACRKRAVRIVAAMYKAGLIETSEPVLPNESPLDGKPFRKGL